MWRQQERSKLWYPTAALRAVTNILFIEKALTVPRGPLA